MSQSVTVQLDLPKDWKAFRLPPALADRLQDLLDQQTRGEKLSPRERREATALTELVDMLALMKLRSIRAIGEPSSSQASTELV